MASRIANVLAAVGALLSEQSMKRPRWGALGSEPERSTAAAAREEAAREAMAPRSALSRRSALRHALQ